MWKKVLALAVAACMLLSCCAAAMAESKVYHVGILQLVQHAALDAATKGFQDKLTELLGEGNVTFDYQNAQGDSAQCSTIALNFVNNAYDLIMANATPALQACVTASADSGIPVVGTSVTDYATALANPDMDAAVGTGINVTGVSDGVNPMLYAQMTMELVPEAKNVSILFCSAEPNSIVQSDGFIAAMAEIAPDVTCSVFAFADSNDMQSVVVAAIENADALYIPTDNTAASNMTIVANACIPAAIPVIAGEENMMSAGGLATVSISYYDVGVLAAQQAYEVLVNGADIGAQPILYSENPVKEYNPDFADAIGFSMPEGYTAFTAE